MSVKDFIAVNAAQLIKENDMRLVNLGIGIPTLIANYLEPQSGVMVHAECGTIGCGRILDDKDWGEQIVDATGVAVELVEGGCCVDSAVSFGLVRNGYVDAAVLGAMQIDENGNLANWEVPGRRVTGMGGAMDIATGAKYLIATTMHTSKTGEHKIVKKCEYPITAVAAVNYIVTDLMVAEFTDQGLVMRKKAKGVSVKEIQEKTGFDIIVSPDLEDMVETD